MLVSFLESEAAALATVTNQTCARRVERVRGTLLKNVEGAECDADAMQRERPCRFVAFMQRVHVCGAALSQERVPSSEIHAYFTVSQRWTASLQFEIERTSEICRRAVRPMPPSFAHTSHPA
jgi:hypothetical protein